MEEPLSHCWSLTSKRLGSLFTQFGWKTLFAMVSVLYFEVLFISLIREQNLLKLSAFLFCFHEIKQVAQVDGICAGSCCCCYLPPSPSIVFPRKACIVKHDWTIFQIPITLSLNVYPEQNCYKTTSVPAIKAAHISAFAV